MKTAMNFCTLLVLTVSVGLHSQDLQSYIETAFANNPNIQAVELRYQVASEKVNETNFIPNTEFSAGYFVSEPETRTGAQKARLSARQMLPWFGTVSARQRYAALMAETDLVDYQIAKRKLALSVAQSYYALYGHQASTQVLLQQIGLLKTYETLALTSVEVGRASTVDVLRLQIRKNELEQRQQQLEEQWKAEQAQFNTLLNRALDTEVSVVDTLPLPEEDFSSSDSLGLNPELLRFDKLYESVVQHELLNQKESAPMWGLGLDFIPVEERPNMTFSDNGKDIVMPMVSLSVPVFNQRYRSITRQNELRKKEIRFQKNARLNVLQVAMAKAIAERNTARSNYATQEKNIHQTQDAEQILLKNYETGTVDFTQLLDVQELRLKFQMQQIEALKTYYLQSAILNYLSNK